MSVIPICLLKQSKPVPKSSAQISSESFQEKEKDYQKEVNALKKQVRTLQKILYSKDVPGPPGSQVQTLADGTEVRKLMQRTKSDITKQNVNISQQNLKNVRNMGVQSKKFAYMMFVVYALLMFIRYKVQIYIF